MKNEELLAFEVALGLKKDTTVNQKSVDKWLKKIPQLNHYAPITKQQSKKVWQSIQKEITFEKPSLGQLFFSKFGQLQYAIPIFLLLMSSIFVFVPSSTQNNNFENAWTVKKDIGKMQIAIQSLTYMPMPENKICVLWIKKDNQLLKVTTLPIKGSKNITVTNKIMSMLKNSQFLISTETKGNISNKPTRIDYIGDWS